MNLTHWDPVRELEHFFDRYRDQGSRLPERRRLDDLAAADWLPKVDIAETQEAFEIHAELPGIDKDNIQVSVREGILILKGHRESKTEEKGKKYHRIEQSVGAFSRSFSLPESVDEDNIRADFNKGILTLLLPKTRKPAPKAIEVNVKD